MHVKRGVMFCTGLVWLAGMSATRVCAQEQSTNVRAREVVAQLPIQDSTRTRPAGRGTERRVTLDLHKVPVKDALRAIAKQSGVVLFYNDHDIPAERRVSIHVENAAAMDALTLVLRGTGLVARVTGAGVVIEQGAARPSQADSLDLDQQQGSIHGRVTDAKTGAGIDGANVTVEGTGLGAISGDSGAYRISGVAPGQYTVAAKRLGYERTSRTVVVSEDQDAAVDFALSLATTMLDQVVVTGTVVPTEVKALPTPVTVITAADFANQPAPRLTQIFRQAVPGAVAPEAGAYFMQTPMSVRGAASLLAAGGTLKVYVDGIEVANKTLAGVDPNSVERIEVIRGPEAAAIYGSDAIGGVMQIFTKRGSLNQRPQVDAQVALGATQSPYQDRSALRQEYTASVHGGGAAMSYSLGGGYTREGDWLPGYSLASPAAYGGIHVANEPFTVDLSVRYISPDVGRPIDPRALRTGYAPFSKPYYYEMSNPTATYGAHVIYTPISWWRHTLTIGVDGGSIDEHSTQPRGTTPGDTLLYVGHQATRKTSIAYNTSVTVPLGAATSGVVTAGVDHYHLTSNGASTTGATRISGTIPTVAGLPFSGYSNATTNSGYFIQGQLDIHDALFLTAALRAEQNSNFGDELGTPFSPRGGISYVHHLGAATVKLRASYGKAISPPAPLLKSAANNGFQIQLENLVLGPERQAGGDVGVDLVLGTRGSLGITGYDQTADGLIQQVLVDPTTNPPTYQYQNVGQVKNRGIEIEGALHWPAVDLTAQYAFTSSRVKAIGAGYSGPLRVGDQSLSIPRHTAGVSITLRPFNRTTLATWFDYTGTSRQTDYLAQFACLGGTGPCAASARDYLATYPSSLETNISVTYDVARQITAFISVQDVSNQIHNEISNLVSNTGRITLAGVRIQSGVR